MLATSVAVASQASAGLEPMDDADLDSVRAQAGMAIAFDDVKIFGHTDYVILEATPEASATSTGDPPPNRLRLTGITFSGGCDPDDYYPAGPMRFNSLEPMTFKIFKNENDLPLFGFENLSYAGSLEEMGVIRELRRVIREELDPVANAADIAQIEAYIAQIEANGYAAWEMDLAIDIDSFAFEEWNAVAGDYDDPQDMGSLHLTGLDLKEFAFYGAPVAALRDVYGDTLYAEGTGIAFQLETRAHIEEFRWDYNDDSDDYLSVAGTHFVGAFDPFGIDGTGDVYEDPSTWRSEERFQIGNLNPRNREDPGFQPAVATFGVANDPVVDRAYLQMHLPMEGSIRMDEVTFSDKNFGPNIIDNMQVHRLQVDFIPWK